MRSVMMPPTRRAIEPGHDPRTFTSGSSFVDLQDRSLPDGAAINEMWNRVTRLGEIEKRVRNGTEPIKYPPSILVGGR